MINRNGASVSPCRTPAVMSKCSASGVSTLAQVFMDSYCPEQGGWNTICFEDLDHLASVDGVEGFTKVDEGYGR